MRADGNVETEACGRGASHALVPGLLVVTIALLGAVRFASAGRGEHGFLDWIYKDDAFYYLEIARNAAEGYGPSFDRIHPTNGFHPLWQAALVPLAAAWPDRASFLAASGALFGALWVGTGLLLLAFGRERGALAPFAIGATLWVASPVVDHCFLLESAASAFFCMGALLASTVAGGRAWCEARGRWLLGLLLGLAVLARLENALLAASLLTVAALRGTAPRRIAEVLGGTALLVVPYGLWNVVLFDTWLPVSGSIKHDDGLAAVRAVGGYASPEYVASAARALRAGLGDALRPLTETAARLIDERLDATRAAAALLALAIVPWKRALPAEARPAHRVTTGLAPLHVFALAHLTLYTVAGYAPPAPWYWVPEWLSVCVGTAQALEALARWSRPAGRVALLVCAALTGSVGAGAVLRARAVGGEDGFGAQALRLEGALSAHVPGEARLAAWNAGAVAFLSDAVVVNLDGLVNAPGFRDEVQRVDWLGYLAGAEIDYVVDFDAYLSTRRHLVAEGLLVDELEATAHLPGLAHSTLALYRVPEATRARWRPTWEALRSVEGGAPPARLAFDARALADALESDDPVLREVAGPLLDDVLAALAARDPGEASITLIGLLAAEREPVRLAASLHLDALLERSVQAPPESLRPALVAAIDDPSPKVRSVALSWLARFASQPPTLVASLAPALEDEDVEVRYAACSVVATVPGADALRALDARLDDPAEPVRSCAREALDARRAGEGPG